jgi:NNP family nitrate/nitrite transporter-like MFS transporter
MVSLLGAVGGFYLPVLFGKLFVWTGNPQSAFLAISLLTLLSLVWLQVVIVQMRGTVPKLVPA